MATQELPPQLALFRIATGYYVSSALYVAAKLGIADLLAEGPQSFDELASATSTHAPSLRRVLRLLCSAGVFVERESGNFELTPLGASLRGGVPGSMRAAVLLFGGPTPQRAWSELMHCVQTGEPAFPKVFGIDAFSYMAEHPEEAANCDQAMADFTKHIGAAIAAAYDFSAFSTIVDVGGGNGEFLAGILKANPALHGILFDQLHAAERAKDHLGALGLSERCTIVGGDFLREVPSGGDAYVLKHVLHDWNDERAATILKNCHRAMRSEGKLLVMEGVYPPRIDGSDASRAAALNDVNMLVCTGGGERSEGDFRSLFEIAGFELTRIVPTATRASVIEGVRS